MTDPRDGADVEALEAIYASLPRMRCRRRCYDSCTSFPLSTLEHRIIRENTGYELTRQKIPPEGRLPNCPALSRTKRCKIYTVRPLICRIFGMTDILPCGFGCIPEGGYLPAEEALVLLNRVLQISGDPIAFAEDELRRRFRSGQLHAAMALRAAMMRQGIDPTDVVLPEVS